MLHKAAASRVAHPPRDGLLKPSIAMTAIMAIALVGTASFNVPPIFVWNASPSVPVGLYVVVPISTLSLGDLALVNPPPALTKYLSRREYLSAGTPMLKRIAALSGQHVCRTGRVIRIDGLVRATAQHRDARERLLPAWSGCDQLQSDEVFFLNNAPNSLDGRYFGPLHCDTIGGQAIPLWTR